MFQRYTPQEVGIFRKWTPTAVGVVEKVFQGDAAHLAGGRSRWGRCGKRPSRGPRR